MAGVMHIGFEDEFFAPLQPSPLWGDFVQEDYEFQPDQEFTFEPGGGIAPTSAYLSYLIAKWLYPVADIRVTFKDNVTGGDTAGIIFRWVDVDNFSLVKAVSTGVVTLNHVIEGASHPPVASWSIPAASLADKELRANITNNQLTVWFDGDNLGQPDTGSAITTVNPQATKCGYWWGGYDGAIKKLTVEVNVPLADPGWLNANTEPPIDGEPTLTAGGDQLDVNASVAFAQIIAHSTTIQLRRRPASVGIPAARATPLIGVLQPIAGSLTGEYGDIDGTGAEARFNRPMSLCMSEDNQDLYVADYGNAAIKKIELNGPLAAPTSTVVSTELMPRFNNPGAEYNDKPKHITIDALSRKMLVIGDTSVADVQALGTGSETIEVFNVAASGKFGDAALLFGGAHALVKYPCGDFVSGWYMLTLVAGYKDPRGNLVEPPGPPIPPFCDPPYNTIPKFIRYWRDGAYSLDGGVAVVPNYDYPDNRAAVIVTHSYVYPYYSGLASVDFLMNGAARHGPYTTCPPIPLPPDYAYPPGGNLFVRDDPSTDGYSERELRNGPDDLSSGGLPTVVASVRNEGGVVIQKTTIQASSEQHVARVDFSHSRGLQYVPAWSLTYNHRTGIYYLALGGAESSSGDEAGWSINRIVALDLYAPDRVAGTLAALDAISFVERVPDPFTAAFTTTDGEAVHVELRIGAGTGSISHIPIGVVPAEVLSLTIVDEDGNVLLDGNDVPLIFD